MHMGDAQQRIRDFTSRRVLDDPHVAHRLDDCEGGDTGDENAKSRRAS